MGLTTSPVTASGGGGSSAPGLPTWTFAAADLTKPDPGHFTTDGASFNATSQIRIHDTTSNGLNVPCNTPTFTSSAGILIVLFTNAAGKVWPFQISSGTNNFDNTTTWNVMAYGGSSDAADWSGIYSISVFPGFYPDIARVLNSSVGPIGGAVTGDFTFSGGGTASFVSGICTAFTPS